MIPAAGLYPNYGFPYIESSASEIDSSGSTFNLTEEQLSRPISSCFSPAVKFIPYGQLPPVPDSNFSVIEKTLSNPRLVRMSLNTIPTTQSLLQSSGLPLTCLFQGLQELPENDSQITKIDYNVYRCINCFGYINGHFTFISGSAKFVCNLCESIQLIPKEYVGNQDFYTELNSGTYEFRAGEQYLNGKGNKPVFLIAIENSKEAVELGVFHQVLTSLDCLIDYVKSECSIGILTYDSMGISLYKPGAKAGGIVEVRFQNLEEVDNSEYWESCVMSIESQKDKLKDIIAKVLENFAYGPGCVSIGHVVSFAEQLLKGNGGRLIIFNSSFGNYGILRLVQAIGVKPIHDIPDKIYSEDPKYAALANICAENDLTVDIFACTNTVLNLPSLSVLCTRTGGDLYYFPQYISSKDGERLHYYLSHILTRLQVTQVSLRVRCTFGLSVEGYIGKLQRKGPVELRIPTFDTAKSILINLKYDTALVEEKDYYIQIAMLYTNIRSERIIRVFNTKVYTTQNFSNIFQNADIDVIVNSYMKIASNAILSKSLNQIRSDLQNFVIKLMKKTRQLKNDSDFSKLRLPESLKLMPLYFSALKKLPAFTLASVSLESRAFSLNAILSMNDLASRLLLYPKIYEVDLKNENLDSHEEIGFNIREQLVHASLKNLKRGKVYCVYNGDVVLTVVGDLADASWFKKLWGKEREEVVQNDEWNFNYERTEYAERFLDLINQISNPPPGAHPSLYFNFLNSSNSFMIKRLMIEDEKGPEVSYFVYVCRLQKSVINLMVNN